MGKVRTKVGFGDQVREIEVDIPDGEPEPWGADAKLSVVGTDVVRVDAAMKVTGRAKYTYDVNLRDMLVAKILHAPHGAATIRKIDTSKAEKMPGVRGVHLFLQAGNPIAYHGDEILAIAADTEEQAEDALKAVAIEYEIKPVVTTIAAAIKPGAPRVFPDRENVGRGRGGGGRGAEAAIRGADKTVEATYETQVQTHSSLEPHGAVAKFNEDGSLTVWCSTQGTFAVKGGAVGQSRLRGGQVRVLAEFVGGGFGSKFSLAPSGIAAVQLAKKTGRPVKCMLTREGEHTTGGNRPSSLQKMKAGVDKDGTIKGYVLESYGSAGVAERGSGVANPVIYSVGASQKQENHVFINGGPGCAMRAPGHPQGIFALDCFIDELAHAVAMDPLEFRKKNCSDEVYHAEWDLGAKTIGWERRPKEPGAGAGPLKRGLGMASTRWGQIGGRGSRVDVIVMKDGSVEVRNGAQDIGTGTKTVLATIVAEELGLKPSQITVKIGDTDFPPGPASGGSTTAPSIGPAARNAGVEAKKQLLALAAKELGVDAKDLRMADGRIAAAGDKSVTFEQACKLIAGDSFKVTGDRSENYAAYRKGVAGCQFAEVEVDTETGQVRVIKVVAIQDAGRVISKLTFESQIAGGVIQGISYALFENRILDRNTGMQVNADFLNYKIAGPMDMPEIIPIAFSVANAGNNCGMAGLGEPPVIPTAAAIGNAIFNATGARLRSLPITPDRVLAALARKDR